MAVPGESAYIYGLHDRGGESLLLVNGQAKGWVLVTEQIGFNSGDQAGGNYKDLADKGLGVIVRLNNAYGPEGTIPNSAKYRDFAQRVANFAKNSSGAHIWIIGNEMNFEREQPRQFGSGEAEPITPRRYADCYRLCREAVHNLPGHDKDQVLVGAPAPWNAQTSYDADAQGKYSANRISGAPGDYPFRGFFGDFVKYLTDICLAIGPENCDGIAIHAYTHGTDPNLVFSEIKMGPPFEKYRYHFRTYRDYMAAIPANMRQLPVYLTEADEDDPWEDANRGWIKNAYKEINDWNQAGNQQIRAVILYRWPRADKWNIDGKLGVQQDLKETIVKNYQWNATASTGGGMAAVTTFNYRTNYVNHNTPAAVPPAQTLTVSLTVQNIGQLTWSRGGVNPFHLGFQWYNAAGQMVAFPSTLDFRAVLPNDVPSGATVTLQAQLRAPDTAGVYLLRWDMVQENVTWFTTQGDQGLVINPVTVSPGVEIPITPTPSAVSIQDVSASLAGYPSAGYPRRATTAIQRIILHHTATAPSVSVQRIADYQVNTRGLAGISYHYCVSDQGVIYLTQPLEVTTSHAGKFSGDSAGVCLMGDFSSVVPPQAQLDAVAALLAQLAAQLRLSVDKIVGYSDLVTTGSPGATWPTWKGPLLNKVSSLLAGGGAVIPIPTPTVTKPIEHYLLFWRHGPTDWAEWDVRGAMTYIGQFGPTVGFSVEEAKSAKYVTIVGGAGGTSTADEQALRAAGCQVERLAGTTETETRRMLEDLIKSGKPYKTLK